MNFRLCLSLLAVAAFGPASLAVAQNQVTSSAWTPAINTSNFVWYPTQMAIRFGKIDSSGSSLWSAANVGDYSFAGGLDAFADDGGFAFGQNASAGAGGFAFGQNAYAIAGMAFGQDSLSSGALVFGAGAYAGYGGVLALGTSSTAYEESIAVGSSSYAADVGVSLGYDSYADLASISIGMSANAAGSYSGAFGYAATAAADKSVALGSQTLVSSYGGVALGYGNKAKTRGGGSPTPSTAAAGDPILMVGNAPQSWGGSDSTRSNALTVYRDGDAHLAGKLRVQPGGDIPMTGFTTVPSGVSYP